jgi:hypothetical protein
MQTIWASQLRLSKQRANKHHTNNNDSKVDRQIRGLALIASMNDEEKKVLEEEGEKYGLGF